MIHLWQFFADRVNVLLGAKLRVPLTGSDMVQIVQVWKQVQRENNEKSQPN
jgi:hypothetical protein